jgi:hypothetical protein
MRAVTNNPSRYWLGIADAARQTSCLPYTPSMLEERDHNSLRRRGLHQRDFQPTSAELGIGLASSRGMQTTSLPLEPRKPVGRTFAAPT